MLTHLSLFSGIGGIDLAAEWAGFKTIAFCEIDPFCQKVLKRHWPDVPIIEDVKDVTKEKVMAYAVNTRLQDRWQKCHRPGSYTRNENMRREIAKLCSGWCRIDLISGGFPCQPHSVAGKRKGSGDERNLWPEFRRVIGEIKPRWVLAENVPGLFSSDSGRFFGNILADLAALGYSVGWCTYGAVDVGALHRRDRVFIICHSKHDGCPTPEITQSLTERGNGSAPWQITTSQLEGPDKQWGIMADTSKPGLEGAEPEGLSCSGGLPTQCCQMAYPGKLQRDRWSDGVGIWQREPLETLQDARERGRQEDGLPVPESLLGRVAYGVPHRVDRLRALGNAVVPQQVYPILKAIQAIEEGR